MALRTALLATVIGLASSSSSPAATVTDSLTGSVDAAGTVSKTFLLNVTDTSVPIQASLDWTTTSANLNMYLTAPGSSVAVAQAISSSARPETINYQPTVTGTFKLRVKAASGASAFTATVSYGASSGGGGGLVSYSKTYGFPDTRSVFPYGLAFDSSDNTLIVGDYWNFRIQRYSAANGSKIATYKNSVQGGVGAPYDIAIDPNDTSACGGGSSATNCSDFWVADQEQQAVVEFDHTGHILHTLGVGGTGSYAHGHGCGGGDMDNPTHLVVDPSNGNIYISNTACKNVYEYAHDGTFIRQFDWSGWKTATGFFQPTPRGIQMDENGNIYVLELNSRTIVVFNQQGQFQRVFPQVSDMNDPRGLDIDTVHHLIYAVGSLHERLFQFDYQGHVLRRWDSTDGTNSPSGSSRFGSIKWPAVDPATGDVYTGDTWKYTIYKFSMNATPIWATVPSPPADGGYTQQTGVAVSPAGTLFVTGSFDQRVQAFDTSLDCRSEGSCPAFLYQWGTRVNPAPNATGFDYPKAMVFADGKLWIGENDGNDIQIYDPSGTWIHRFGTQGPAVGSFRQGIQGLYVDSAQGKVFATDVGNCRLQVFDESFVLANTSGQPIKAMGGCGTASGQLSAPRGVVAEGNTAYVIETGGSKISVWNWTTGTELATYKPTCGGTTMSGPWDAAWDPSHTWIYIGDKVRARVVRWNPTTHACDVVTTGTETPEGHLSGPDFLNFGPDGKLYVSDNNKRVYSFTIN
jgi:sugar lactone lactonase YvrE